MPFRDVASLLPSFLIEMSFRLAGPFHDVAVMFNVGDLQADSNVVFLAATLLAAVADWGVNVLQKANQLRRKFPTIFLPDVTPDST